MAVWRQGGSVERWETGKEPGESVILGQWREGKMEASREEMRQRKGEKASFLLERSER